MVHTAEIVVLSDRQYVLIDHYIAIRVDALAEQYGRRFTEWRRELQAQEPEPTQLSLPFDPPLAP